MKNNMFVPENRDEEALMLMGRIEAVAAYINRNRYIERKIIADMLGMDLAPSEESKDESVSL